MESGFPSVYPMVWQIMAGFTKIRIDQAEALSHLKDWKSLPEGHVPKAERLIQTIKASFLVEWPRVLLCNTILQPYSILASGLFSRISSHDGPKLHPTCHVPERTRCSTRWLVKLSKEVSLLLFHSSTITSSCRCADPTSHELEFCRGSLQNKVLADAFDYSDQALAAQPVPEVARCLYSATAVTIWVQLPPDENSMNNPPSALISHSRPYGSLISHSRPHSAWQILFIRFEELF